jgi:hypothetical protein
MCVLYSSYRVGSCFVVAMLLGSSAIVSLQGSPAAARIEERRSGTLDLVGTRAEVRREEVVVTGWVRVRPGRVSGSGKGEIEAAVRDSDGRIVARATTTYPRAAASARGRGGRGLTGYALRMPVSVAPGAVVELSCREARLR